MPPLDAIVIGLGAAGSAALYHLAQRGARVVGFDRFRPPHGHGSSHGESRIIRRAYYEGARYLPLLERSYELWRELERTSGRRLLEVTGGLMIGMPEGALVAGSRASAEAYGIAHEMLSAQAVSARFPAFALPEDHVALWEPEAGLLHAEACIEAHVEAARRHGARTHMNEAVREWRPDGDGIAVTTTAGTYRAGRLVVCAGGWVKALLFDLALPLTIERQVNGWFRPTAHAEGFSPAHCPVYMWERTPDEILYGFPDLGSGVKAGLHHGGAQCAHPGDLVREPTSEDKIALRRMLRRLLPDADGPLLRAQTCFYTNTPDKDYLIDRHPAHPNVVFASACSGHGFKASPAVGEALAELALEGGTRLDLSAFRHRRLTDG
ncbi:MAG: N-methyl-L-tryptophan oxidase [Rhodothermales bacterium]